MSQLGTVYATKRRRRNGKSLKPPPKDGLTKSNPSKRHRERLNAELDLLASLLPFEQNILSKLDRLSILRLSVSYLRTKSYFQSVMHKDKDENGVQQHQQHQQHSHHSHQQHPHNHSSSSDAYVGNRLRELEAIEQSMLEGDMFLQALNGFLMILSCDGEVFFATHSIESYLGFHQSDIVHQSVYELVHSEDREELQRQLLWNSFLPGDCAAMSLAETLAADRAHLLERSFTVRFRCLLDNTSGFLRLDIRGRVKIMHGQNRKCEEPPLGLFAYCTPFGPPSLLEIPQKENMFKSKHKLDFSLVSMDQRGKSILGFSDAELASMGGYDLVHFDDLAYVASAHQELLKTGASGMIAYRYQKKNNEWQWLQTSSRLVYKNSKPDFVICTHRQLMEEEGRDLLGKRTMDFKVSYLDTGLASTYFSESDQLVAAPSGSPNSLPPPTTPHKPTRRYKTQLRDFLSTCRSKRKLQQQQQHPHHPQQQTGQHGSMGQMTPPISSVTDYMPDPAAAVAAAYSNLGNPMYSSSPYAPNPSDNLYMSPVSSVHHHSSNYYPSVTDSMFHQYRLQGVGSYYPEYHHSAASTAVAATYAVTNGFLPYDSYSLPSASAGKSDDKSSSWSSVGHHGQESSSSPGAKYYAASQHDDGGRASCAGGGSVGVYAGYISPATPTATASATAAATSASAEAASAAAAALAAAAATSSAAASAAAHSTSSPSTSTQIQIHSTMKTPKPSPSSTTAAAAVAVTGTAGGGLVVSIGPADPVSCSTESPGPTASGSPAVTPRPRAVSSSVTGRQRPSAADALKSEHGHCGSTGGGLGGEAFERQTVLMWGSTSNSNASSSNRSPNSTPTPNGTVYSHAQLVATSSSSVLPEHHQSNGRLSHGPKASSMTPSPADCSAAGDHLTGKWNGSLHSHKDDDAAVQVYQITHLPTATEAAHTYRMQQQQQHQHAEPQHQQHHHHQHHHHHQQQQHMQQQQQMTSQQQQQQHQLHGDGGVVVVDSSESANQSVGQQATGIAGHHGPHATSIGGSCEVWSPSYSQYQYFTYHHAPQHASTQQSCSTHFNQHRSHHHLSSAVVLDSSTSTPPPPPPSTTICTSTHNHNSSNNHHNHSRFGRNSNTTTASNGGASASLRSDSSRTANHRHYHPVHPHHPHQPHRPQSQHLAVGSVHPHLQQHPHFQQHQQHQQQQTYHHHHPGHHHQHHRSLSAGVLCYPSLR